MQDRIERLEGIVALQDSTVDKLSKVIYEQQRQIDSLERQLEVLAKKFKELSQAVDQGAPHDAPPPHYGGNF